MLLGKCSVLFKFISGMFLFYTVDCPGSLDGIIACGLENESKQSSFIVSLAYIKSACADGGADCDIQITAVLTGKLPASDTDLRGRIYQGGMLVGLGYWNDWVNGFILITISSTVCRCC